MALIKGKIIGFSTFKDAVTENGGRMSDIILVITRPTVTIKPGNVIFISNFPDNTMRHLANMNGYHIIEEFSNRPDGVSTNIYLTEGRAENKGDANTTTLAHRDYDYPKQADYEINTDCFTLRKGNGITGWNKGVDYAQDWMKQADGKITECRRIYKWLKEEIIPTAEVLIIEPQNVGEFAGIADDVDRCLWSAEAAFNQCKGLQNTKNGYFGYLGGNTINNGKDYVQRLSDVYKAAAERMEGIEDVFKSKERRTIDFMKRTLGEKLWDGIKAGGLAPLRLLIQIALQYNVMRFGYAMYELKKQKPAKYEDIKMKWRQLSGDRTKFDQFVEKGGKTKSRSSSADGFYAAAGDEALTTEVIKLPSGVGGGIAGIGVALSQTASAGTTAAVVAPYAVKAGLIIEGMAQIINAAGIFKRKNEPDATTPDTDPNTLPPVKPDDPNDPNAPGLAGFYYNNKGIVWGAIGLIAAGTLILIFRKKLFKK